MLLGGLQAVPASAATRPAASPDYWFAGTRVIWSKPQKRGDELAIANDDAGLGRFLARLGAIISYDPGQRYAVITSGDRRTISFAVGDARYTVAGVTQTAPFAPYVAGRSVYLPFSALAKALYVSLVADGSATVLQPQIGGLDIKVENKVTQVTFRSASPPKFKIVSDPSDPHLAIQFSGVGSTLEKDRHIGGSAEVHGMTIRTGGTARNPTTTVIFDAMSGTSHVAMTPQTQNEIAIGFAFKGVAMAGTPLGASAPAVAQAMPNPTRESAGPSTNEYARVGAEVVPPDPAIPPPALSAAALVTAVEAIPDGQTLNVRIGVTGPVSYEWHRLPDNRWYVDLKNATLGVPARDEQPNNMAASSLRIRQLSTAPDPVVRIALSLASQRQVQLLPSDGGFTIAVGALDNLDAQRVGSGKVVGGSIVAAATPAGGDMWSPPVTAAPSAPVYMPTNPKLIVIDPGHGGSDSGAARNGLVEKDIALDVSKRLRAVLIARGWQVKMTRETDVDVYAPNDSAHDELQARCDVANTAGARMFISVHVNSFTSSSLNGSTTYYYKPSDQALGDAIHRSMSASLNTTDKGLRKEDFYVIKHTLMPAALVETAFLSNVEDAKLLRSPAFLQRMAVSIADGIGSYAAKVPAGNYSSGT
ncbi:MAG: N-acetylmuramoyl-L-alanine amidase [Candidatus Eremiobacteraeota bacterium]|nr:N-acetylmuramoyl-L-alanine amidase [Candidatus Eremiobacteraeota bacterium]